MKPGNLRFPTQVFDPHLPSSTEAAIYCRLKHFVFSWVRKAARLALTDRAPLWSLAVKWQNLCLFNRGGRYPTPNKCHCTCCVELELKESSQSTRHSLLITISAVFVRRLSMRNTCVKDMFRVTKTSKRILDLNHKDRTMPLCV